MEWTAWIQRREDTLSEFQEQEGVNIIKSCRVKKEEAWKKHVESETQKVRCILGEYIRWRPPFLSGAMKQLRGEDMK